jgi:hypothetical protein
MNQVSRYFSRMIGIGGFLAIPNGNERGRIGYEGNQNRIHTTQPLLISLVFTLTGCEQTSTYHVSLFTESIKDSGQRSRNTD